MSYELDKYVTKIENVNDTLSKYGVAIIPSMLSEKECKKINNGMVKFFEHITSSWPTSFKINNKKTWRELFKLYPMHSMLYQHWKIGHSQHVWDVRQNPKVAVVFAKIWGCKIEDLLVSFDGASFHLPPEDTSRGWYNKTWLHTDQSPTRNDLECIQSLITSLDVNEGDATFCCLEGSNKYHKEFAKQFGITDKCDWYKLNEGEINFFKNKGCTMKKIKCPAGSMVLWDSRTIHCGVEALKRRSRGNFRSVVYVCMTPRALCSQKDLEKRKKAFEEMRMTTHWPHKPKLFPVNPRTYGGPLPEIEDIPKPSLNALGKKLVGY
jgi:hypothetical protein